MKSVTPHLGNMSEAQALSDFLNGTTWSGRLFLVQPNNLGARMIHGVHLIKRGQAPTAHNSRFRCYVLTSDEHSHSNCDPSQNDHLVTIGLVFPNAGRVAIFWMNRNIQ